ncbi:alpha-glucan family phosphorylase [Thiohalobacter sp. IOR34]|uniref:alpha-glucan family phosphorylase n=1 Tax=Thiohalobacter sp. IOR34 TaxID=3057176 RepID=UPI0025B03C4A|nr:alpha-glucan family phosphorylase [Thiohalobacter sp. IOR34]WJW76337.1 alpha-glucan family phosphorylase [Thiohalobacter sp. IOR34]
MDPSRYLHRALPGPLSGLADLAMDLRWSWNHGADRLWQTVDPELWELTGDPWLILESVAAEQLDELARNPAFLRELQDQLERRRAYLSRRTWFEHNGWRQALRGVAYFSMEFGLAEALPIYSGGLGVLAGDVLKTASDLGVPLVGVGLLYQQGYFRQAIDANGDQLAFFPYNDPTMLPVMPLRDARGEWLRVPVELPGRVLQLRTWQARVGRCRLYLLDSNDLLNRPGDRGITSVLYAGSAELRLQQEMVLGIGGWRLLEALGQEIDICHINEGHAALVVLERARSFMERSGQRFEVALRATCAGNLFTTHTPVAAGFDRFPPTLIEQYLGDYARQLGLDLEALLALGRAEGDGAAASFNMAALAMRGTGRVNGVSRLHGEVSRRIFLPLFPRWPQAEVPVGHVTNGVHTPSWDSAAADALWTGACGKRRWLDTQETVEADFRTVSDEALWELRARGRQAMIAALRRRLRHQRATRGRVDPATGEPLEVLEPDTLTLGFARRFTEYKRPNLLLQDPQRLERLLGDPQRPVQLVIAGKAHPQDEVGRRLVREWIAFSRRPGVRNRVVFVEDYDMGVAADLVQGVDLWINTPRRPWEACGTSGMKVLVNGGLNLSELDGWWAEAYEPALGWALGDGREHDSDPAWDRYEADCLYRLLEEEVVPAFYRRDERGLPVDWLRRIRESMARLTPRFSSNRMLRQYTESYYLPMAAALRRRCAGQGRLAAELEALRDKWRRHWPMLHFGDLTVSETDGELGFRVAVYLDDLDAGEVRVQLYADPLPGQGYECVPMQRSEAIPGAFNGFFYTARLPAARPAADYTPRIVPYHPEAAIPLEADLIFWKE